MSEVSELHDRFDPEPLPHWNRYLVGDATMEQGAEGVRLILEGASARRYSNSELDDFHGRPREAFLWRPPVRLSVRARFSHGQSELRGTAGFGWWNDPFEQGRATEVAVGPQAIWFFFGSPPSNLAATPGWSGNGWFAQMMSVPTVPGWLVKLGMIGMRLPLARRLARRGAGTIGRAAERPLHEIDLTEWHHYVIDWREHHVDFYLDGSHLLRGEQPPGGPLGLVLWMDNQWATIEGRGGVLDVPSRQWLELGEVQLDRPPAGDQRDRAAE